MEWQIFLVNFVFEKDVAAFYTVVAPDITAAIDFVVDDVHKVQELHGLYEHPKSDIALYVHAGHRHMIQTIQVGPTSKKVRLIGRTIIGGYDVI